MLLHSFSKLFITCLVSAALHGAIGMFIITQNTSPNAPILFKNKSIQNKNIFLEFIPAPEVQEKKPKSPTSIIAEKNTIAQNPFDQTDLLKGNPYQKGTVRHESLKKLEAGSWELEAKKKLVPERKLEAQPSLDSSDGRIGRGGSSKLEAEKKLKASALKKNKFSTFKTSRLPDSSSTLSKTSRGGQPLAVLANKRGASSQNSLQTPAILNNEMPSPAQKNVESVADILDEWSYNTHSHAVAQYFSKEFKKISNVWRLELYSSQELANGTLSKIKKTIVVFKIMPNGSMKDLEVIEHIGPELTQRYAVFSVEKTAPFTPLPTDVLSYIRTDGLWIKIEFNYSRTGKD